MKWGLMSTVVALAEARTGQELNVLDDAVKHGYQLEERYFHETKV